MSCAAYFAYGSNMNPRRVRDRGLRHVAIRAARLPNVDLCFDKRSADHEGAHANLAWLAGGACEGLLYELDSAQEIERMDPFEHAPVNYSREVVQVETAAGSISAWTYFANPAVRVEPCAPKTDYLAHLLAGRPWLSPAWFARLASWPTLP